MKALYVEPFAGISGNMLLGALMDAGVPFDFLRDEFAKLHLGEYELVNKSVNKSGIQARYFNVALPEEHAHTHEHEHEHAHEREHEHHHDHEEAHDHAWMHAHGIAHEHHHEHAHGHDHEHCHEHHHEHDHAHHHHERRNLRDIEAILDHSDLSKDVIAKAKAVFLAIAKAEAKVHGSTVEEIHFHEVGAIDTIIDVVGNILALQYLGIEKLFTAPVNTGFGFVECAHGQMPVPAPATAELLQGIPHYRGSVAKEMTTPTGAALLKALAVPVEEAPAGFTGEVIGYGAGTRDVAIPNVLRVNVGAWEEKTNTVHSAGAKDCGEPAGTATVCAVTGIAADAIAHTGAQATDATDCVETLLALECNLDDMNPELLPYVMEKLLAAGANDAWLQPIIMKKGRPAHLLKVLCAPEQQPAMQRILFTETTTLGVRAYPVQRTALERRWRDVATPWGNVRVKEGVLNGEVVNAAPEFEDCKRVATESGQPLKVIEASALQPNH